MKNIILIFSLLVGFTISAQEYTTPNSGVNWTLEDLMQESPETVESSDGAYTIKQEFLVAENDTLTFEAGDQIFLDEEVLVRFDGTWHSIGTEESMVHINATDNSAPYDGFRLQGDKEGFINYTSLKNGGGILVITPNFIMTNSVLKYNRAGGVNTGGTINISNGTPLIENNEFYENELPAVGSGANAGAAPKILNNYIEANTQSNQNRPQLNFGSTGADTLKIIGNTIIGDREMTKVGGISIANLIGGEMLAVIEGNTISDNRYGINIQGAGNSFVKVINNVIEDNDTQGNPALGGSGVSMNSGSVEQVTVLSGNEIRRNLWGITVIGQATANLGEDEDNPGENVFSENGNGGEIYAIYNNTPNTVMAKHNCWIEGEESTLEEVAEVIFDQADDPSLGEVIYDPIICGELSVPYLEKDAISIYPNPTSEMIYFNNSVEFQRVAIFDINGKSVLDTQLHTGENSLSLNLNSGVYLLRFEGAKGVLTKKLVVK